jgi:hypothetical protein
LSLLSPPSSDGMVDDFAEDGDGAAGRSVAGGGEESKLGLRMLGVLGFRVGGLTGVHSPKLREV